MHFITLIMQQDIMGTIGGVRSVHSFICMNIIYNNNIEAEICKILRILNKPKAEILKRI